MVFFNDWVHAKGLVDLSKNGLNFTWSNSLSKLKLDRFFTLGEFLVDQGIPNAFYILRVLSNHVPILFGVPKVFIAR